MTSSTVAENAQDVAAASAKAAARDAMARGVDPLVVVDLALTEITRFRVKTGLTPQYVAQDPLASLVAELRHKRVPAPFARVLRALASASVPQPELREGYDDGHERRRGDWSLMLLLDLADLAALDGSRAESVKKAVALAGYFASMLVGWQESICEEMDGIVDIDDPEIRAEIASAADAFIAGLNAFVAGGAP